MSYVEDNLNAGEVVLYRTHLHWVVLSGHVVAAVLFGLPGFALLIGAIATFGGGSGSMAFWGFALLLIAALLIGVGVLMRNATEMAVTNRRVLIKTGLLTRKTVEVFLTKIESVGVSEPLLGRMLGYGSVTVKGTGGTPEPFHKIAHPLEFRRHVQNQIEAQQLQGLR